MDDTGDEPSNADDLDNPTPGEPPAPKPSQDDLVKLDDSDDVLDRIARDVSTVKFLATLILVVLLVGIVLIGVLVRTKDNDSSTSTAAASTTTTAAPASTVASAESAAGKPCVATVDPLPAGAPPVDVVVGPAPTSLVVKDLKEGTGAAATAADTVTLNYIGVACSTGKIFDSSYKSGQPATFAISGVIPGFGQGVTGMKVGGQRLLGIPSDQAYGPTGSPPVIAPDEALWFVVELTAITPGN